MPFCSTKSDHMTDHEEEFYWILIVLSYQWLGSDLPTLNPSIKIGGPFFLVGTIHCR